MINRIEFDMHTHSVFSGHAYSTLEEMVAFAQRSGLRGFCLTDHSPRVGSVMDCYLPLTFETMPGEIDGVRVFYGMEVDVLDERGGLALPQEMSKTLQFGIFGFHETAMKPGRNIADYTAAAEAAFADPYYDLFAHPCRERFPVDAEVVVHAAKRRDKLLELNENCLRHQSDGGKNYRRLLELCREHDVRITVNSDAHFSRKVGGVETAIALLREMAFPTELVVNATLAGVENYMKERAARIENQERK